MPAIPIVPGLPTPLGQPVGIAKPIAGQIDLWGVWLGTGASVGTQGPPGPEGPQGPTGPGGQQFLYAFGTNMMPDAKLSPSQGLVYHRLPVDVTWNANFAAVNGLASEAGGSANATASTVIDVQLAPNATPNTFTSIGSITFAAGTVTPTFATAGGVAQSALAGDVVRFVAPASPDATFAGFYATLVGQETTIRPTAYAFGSSSDPAATLSSDEDMLYHRLPVAVTFPANFGAVGSLTSEAGGSVNATGNPVILVQLAAAATPTVFSTIGTITIGAGTVNPTFATSGGLDQPALAGDVVRLRAPTVPDATFSGFYSTIVGFET